MPNANSELEKAKLTILEQFEKGMAVDISEWIRRYPQERAELLDELLDYWMWLSATEHVTTWRRFLSHLEIRWCQRLFNTRA